MRTSPTHRHHCRVVQSKNDFPTSEIHLTIQSEFPYQEKLTNMDALLLLQPIRNKKSRQTYDLRKAVRK